MNKKEFESRMLEEWRENVLNYYSRYCELPQFDQLKDLADCGELYNLFHPLGINSVSLKDIAKVCSDLVYAVEDDGDLSIIIAKVRLWNRYTDRKNPFEGKPKLYDFFETMRYKKTVITDFFVMHGHKSEILFGDVSKWALTFSSREDVLESYQARSFNYDSLNVLHSFVPRFNELRRLAKEDMDSKELFSRKSLIKYIDYKEETTKLLEEAFLNLKS